MSSDLIPLKLLEHWIEQLKGHVREKFHDEQAVGRFDQMDLMLLLSDNIGDKCRTWLEHRRNLEKMDRLNKRIMATQKDEIVPITQGRLMKLKWYEPDRFLILSHGWGMANDGPRIMFHVEDTTNLSTEFLVYQGSTPYGELVQRAEAGGLAAIRNENNLQEWVPFE
jgi:hypothetical protein